MTLDDLVRDLRRHRLHLVESSGTIRWRAPKGAEIGDLLGTLRKRIAEVTEYVHAVADPRPDIVDDSELWGWLLEEAYAVDGDSPNGLFGSLHGVRSGGGRLQTEWGQVALTAGDWGEEYPRLYERWLKPFAPALTTLFERAAKGRAARSG